MQIFLFLVHRAEYNPKNDLLDEEFMLKGKWYLRKDLEVRFTILLLETRDLGFFFKHVLSYGFRVA